MMAANLQQPDSAPEERRFCCFKQSIDGNQDRWGHIRNLTREECTDLDRYPPGTLRCKVSGRPFVWSYALMQ